MSHEPLSNYLRTQRRRSRLSQDEIAFLMGTFCGTSVSRHERGSRIPSLEAAIAYECIFGQPVVDLFEGEAAKIRMGVKERAIKLRRSLKYRFNDTHRETKIRHLTQLLEGGRKKRGA